MFDKEYKYDFLPSNLQIIEKPPSPLGGFIIYFLAISIVVLIILSCIFTIDKVVVTRGTVEVEGGIKTVNTNLNSKIIKIHKKEGDTVKEGEVVMELEDNSGYQIKQAEKELDILKIEKLMKESMVNEIRNDTIFDNSELSSNKIEELKLEYEIYWSEKLKEEKDFNKNIQKYQKQLNDEELDSKEKEYAQEQIDELYYEDEQSSIQENYQLISELNTITEKIEDTENTLKLLKSESDKNLITSPVDGTISLFNYTTEGSYVNTTTPIMEVVPKNAEFIIKAEVSNNVVSKLKVGQKVSIKVDAYDYQEFGKLEGEIITISETSKLNDQKNALNYEIFIHILEYKDRMELKSGMTVSLDINTGNQKVIEYVFDPILKTVDEAF